MENRFDIGNTPRSGRPSGFDEDRLIKMIHVIVLENRANVMNCDHSTIVRHLHSVRKIKKSGVWVPHGLSQNHTNQRVVICAYLLARHRLAREQHRPFLSCFVTGDEKAIIRIRKEWISSKKKPSAYKDLFASTKDNVMHLVEQRGCAVNQNDISFLHMQFYDQSCRRNPCKTTDKTA